MAVSHLTDWSLTWEVPTSSFATNESSGWHLRTRGNVRWEMEFGAVSDGSHPEYTLGTSYSIVLLLADLSTDMQISGAGVLDEASPQGAQIDTGEEPIRYRYRLQGDGTLSFQFGTSPSASTLVDGTAVNLTLT